MHQTQTAENLFHLKYIKSNQSLKSFVETKKGGKSPSIFPLDAIVENFQFENVLLEAAIHEFWILF